MESTSLPILLQEWPYVHVINEDQAQLFCHHCFKGADEVAKLYRCSRCKFAQYCGKKCQTMAHKDHLNECKRLLELKGVIPSSKARLMARIIFKANEVYKPDERLPAELQKRQFQDLMNHGKEILEDENGKIKEFRHVCVELNRYLGSEYCLTENVLLDIYGKLAINAFGIHLSSNNLDVGEGLYVGTSILDHSCDPDAYVYFDGPNIIIRAVKSGVENKPLKEVKISYFDTFKSTQERRALTTEAYYFSCDCSFCNDEKMNSEMRSVLCSHCSGVADLNANDSTATCQQCQKVTDATSAVALMKEIEHVFKLQEMSNRLSWTGKPTSPDAPNQVLTKLNAMIFELDKKARSQLSPINVYACRLAASLQDMTDAAGRMDLSVGYCERSLKGLMHFGHPLNPRRLLQMKNLGMVFSERLDRVEDGIRLLREAERGYSLIDDQRRAKQCRTLLASALTLLIKSDQKK